MDCKGIVRAYLVEHGYDGLVSDGECGCSLEELFACDDSFGDCEPGYKVKCSCGEGHDYHIATKREVE